MAQSKLLRRILSRLTACKIIQLHKAPFDFLIRPEKGKMTIIGGIAGKKEKGLESRLDEILSISKVIHAYPVFISERRQIVKSNDVDFHCINGDELLHAKNPRELMAILK